jgi:hypothetical protein
MNRQEEAFARWAPADSPWSDWAKPALFATSPTDPPASVEVIAPLDSDDLRHLPEPRERTAIVLDIPGRRAVRAALALANRGYRPVPLFNTTYGARSVVDVLGIVHALMTAGETLEQMRIDADAPPVFLLDSGRLPRGSAPEEGKFDNRWMVFPQDFPSATMLLRRGIGRALIVQDGDRVRDDLAHVVLRWQQAGITLSTTDTGPGERVRPLLVSKPRLYRRAWYRVLAMLGLRRSNVGGFGSVVPIASSSGGFMG